MKREVVIRRIKLGIFVLLAGILLTGLIFYIGSHQHKFGTKKNVYALFKDVSGLTQGNSVRFQGVTIGAVEGIQIVSDSLIRVDMVIDEKAAKFIKKDSEVNILTEGVLGSKFVSISAGTGASAKVENNDRLPSRHPQDFDDLVAVLTETTINAKNITSNLEDITRKINEGEGTIGTLIADKTLLTRVENMIGSFEKAGRRTDYLTNKLSVMADTLTIAGGNAVLASENAVMASENIVDFTNQLNHRDGPLQRLIGDTVLAENMEKTVNNMNQAAKDVGQTSCRIRNHWFMRMFAKKDK